MFNRVGGRENKSSVELGNFEEQYRGAGVLPILVLLDDS